MLANDDVLPNERLAAISQRADKTLFRAMLNGSLRAWFTDGVDRWQIPGWAWADQGGDWNGLIGGNDFLHALLPPEIRRWARHAVLIDRTEFETWLDSDELDDQAGFPDLPPAYDETERPAHITQQDPPNTSNVSLSHAISWLAFGIALDEQTFWSALCSDVLCPDRSVAHRRMGRAVEKLLTAGTGGLPFFGKFVPTGGDHGAPLTERIAPERLEDFRKFGVLNDTLLYGTGLHYDLTAPGLTAVSRAFPSADRKFIDVKVERAGLMAAFPPPSQMPGPAPAPNWPTANAGGQIEAQPGGETIVITGGERVWPGDDFDLHADVAASPWWSFSQTVGWIMTGSKSYAAYVATHDTNLH